MIKNICSILLILIILYFCIDSKVKDELFKKYKFLILFGVLFLFLTQSNIEGFENPACNRIQERVSSGPMSSYLSGPIGRLLSGVSECNEVVDPVSEETCGVLIQESLPPEVEGSTTRVEDFPEWIQTSCEPLVSLSVSPLETQISDFETQVSDLEVQISDLDNQDIIQTLRDQKGALISEKAELESEKAELISEKTALVSDVNRLEGVNDSRAVNCYGEWTPCNDLCKKRYDIQTPASNGGKDCIDDSGNIYTDSMSDEERTVECHRGENKNCKECKNEFWGWGCPKDDNDKKIGLDPID